MITHGPPKGVMDYTLSKQRAGCPGHFKAIAQAQPRLHCLGHIHEGWGAQKVAWREPLTENPSHFTDIDNDRSILVENLSSFKHSRFDPPDVREEISKKERFHRQEKYCFSTHCHGDAHPLEYGAETLFFNAAIQSDEENSLQLPWLVDLELPKAI